MSDDCQFVTYWEDAVVYLNSGQGVISGKTKLYCKWVRVYATWVELELDTGGVILVSASRIRHIRKVSEAK